MNRGDHREEIFRDDLDRQCFLETLEEACNKMKYVEQQKGKWHYGTELRESAEAKAERLIQEALRNQPVAQDQLFAWRKGHPFKLALAKKLREETTVTVEWIAQRLSMGSRGYLAQSLIDENQTTSANKTPHPESGI